MLNVKLIAYTPDPEKTIAAAAKICYSSSDAETIMEGLTPEKTESFLDMLTEIGHASPIEHASFTFGVEGISRACSHQLVRHRIASYSQQSQRYVDGNSFEFVTPPEIESDPHCAEVYSNVIELQKKAYADIRDALVVKYIREVSDKDYKGTDAEIIEAYKAENKAQCSAFIKKANEDARYILPNACTTKIVCTFNVRSLENFFAHRCCNRAQWEIREVAHQMLMLCKEVAPNMFRNSGPSCMRGKCPEGNMTCGKIKEVREKYGK